MLVDRSREYYVQYIQIKERKRDIKKYLIRITKSTLFQWLYIDLATLLINKSIHQSIGQSMNFTAKVINTM